MKLFVVALVAILASVSSSSIPRPPQQNPLQDDFVLEPIAEESSEEVIIQKRSLISTFKTATNLISSAKNQSLATNLKTAAGVVADVALTAVTGTDEGAALAKTAIGVVGEVVQTTSSALSKTSLANNTLAQNLLNGTSSVGGLMSDYGGGEKTLSTVINLIQSVTSGNVTLQKALATAGVSLIDSTLTPTKEKLTIAGKTLEIVGGVIETLGDAMSDSANSTTEDVLESIVTTLGADTILNTTFSVIDKVLNISIEDIISEKLSEFDDSTSSVKERVVAVGQVFETVGVTLTTLGETFEELGDSSIADYVSIIKEALSELSTSSSTSSSS